jgi:5'-nucleotidase
MTTRGLQTLGLILSVTGSVQALEIAVTNDDGWNAIGLLAVHEALQKAGHQATLVGPGANQSGSSAALSLGALRVVREADSRYSVWSCANAPCEAKVSASPATSALVALELVRQKRGGVDADLLISGINSGPNLGPAISVSGTVGAATVSSLTALGRGVPAISISTETPLKCAEDRACLKEHYDRVAGFLAQLVADLADRASRRGHQSVLPRGQVLNINVPAAIPRGLRWANRSAAFYARGTHKVWRVACDACGSLGVGGEAPAGMVMAPVTNSMATRNGDTELFVAGYTTLEFLSPLGRRISNDGWRWLAAVAP